MGFRSGNTCFDRQPIGLDVGDFFDGSLGNVLSDVDGDSDAGAAIVWIVRVGRVSRSAVSLLIGCDGQCSGICFGGSSIFGSRIDRKRTDRVQR